MAYKSRVWLAGIYGMACGYINPAWYGLRVYKSSLVWLSLVYKSSLVWLAGI